ncbi:MAG: ABC-F family ATP-binding cassette domain-containing protein [Phototrophicaceae bacterium]
MSILSFDKLSRAYGGNDIFINLDGKIEVDSKIGLVGPNGIGKTTLLQLLAGVEETLTGEIYRADNLSIGYLRQEAVLAFADKENTLGNEMLLVFERVFEMERKMRSIEQGMADGSATDEDYDLYGDLQIKVDLHGLYDYERRIERTLDGLGFSKEDWDKPINILSGGQKTRALLGKLVLEVPDLLILDEPTNHLDIEAIRWLEGILHVWDGALMIVSHDRYFLDRVVNRVWEMSPINIEEYKGNYTAYLRQRAERRTRIQIEWDAMMERFWSELKFIQKHTLADLNAKGRFKRITREVEAIQSHGIDALRYIKRRSWSEYTNNFERKNPPATVKALEKAIKGLKSPLTEQKDMRVKLVAEERSGEVVLRGRNLEIGYERNDVLFTADDFELIRGDVAALIGPNGVGKSSMLKTILDKIPALKGHVNFGVGLEIGYFAQAHDELNHENTVLEELMSHKNIGIQAARKYLAPYLFRGDDVFKQVSALSGGERGRLALAILGLKGANLLLLDEPTNHLDIPAQEVLQEVLESYDGTIILVTHDRYLVDRLASQIWDLQDGHMRVFKGTYEKYLTVVEAEEAENKANDKPTKKAKKEVEVPSVDPKLVQRMETQISTLEGEIRELETLLAHASAAGNGDTITMLSKQYKAQQNKLHELNVEWEDLATKA